MSQSNLMTNSKILSFAQEGVEPAIEVLRKAFIRNPIMTYFTNTITNEDDRIDHLKHFFTVLLTAAALNGASFETVTSKNEEWDSCGVFMTQGSDLVGKGGNKKIIENGFEELVSRVGDGLKQKFEDFDAPVKAAKSKAFEEGDKYYYVFFLGTLESARGRGLGSKIIRHYQDIATKDRVPLWLEAGDENAWRLYEKLGFETVHKWKMGVGSADSLGRVQDGGEGFAHWGMVWRPGFVKGEA